MQWVVTTASTTITNKTGILHNSKLRHQTADILTYPVKSISCKVSRPSGWWCCIMYCVCFNNWVQPSLAQSITKGAMDLAVSMKYMYFFSSSPKCWKENWRVFLEARHHQNWVIVVEQTRINCYIAPSTVFSSVTSANDLFILQNDMDQCTVKDS